MTQTRHWQSTSENPLRRSLPISPPPRPRERNRRVFVVISGIFMKDGTTFADPVEAEKRARAIVKAATHFNDPKVLLEVSEDLAGAMKGLAVAGLDEAQMLQTRGW